MKSITYKSKVNLSALEYSQPNENLIKSYFLFINTLDVYTTYRGLKSPYVYESNPLLDKNPSLSELIAFKFLIGSVMWHGFTAEEMIIPNVFVTVAVINNIDVMHQVGIISL